MIQDPVTRGRAFAAVARMMASSDLKRAVSITEVIQDKDLKSWTLAHIVRALAC